MTATALDVVKALRFDANPDRAGVVLEEYLTAFSGTASASPPSATRAVQAIREDLPERAALIFADFVAATINGGGTSILTATAIAAMVKHDPLYARVGLVLAAYVATQTGANAGGGGGGGDTPAWLPAGAVAHADFSAGHYYAGGEITQAQFVSGTVDGTGLVVGDAVDNALGAAVLTAINALSSGLTVVASISTTDVNGYNTILGLANADASDDFEWTVDRVYSNPANFSVTNSVPPSKVAGTLTATHIAVSADGSDVVSNEVPPPATIATGWGTNEQTQGWLGSWAAGDYLHGHILSITIYPPKADADLPALSALT